MDFHVNRETYDSWRRKLISDYEAEKAALLDKHEKDLNQLNRLFQISPESPKPAAAPKIAPRVGKGTTIPLSNGHAQSEPRRSLPPLESLLGYAASLGHFYVKDLAKKVYDETGLAIDPNALRKTLRRALADGRLYMRDAGVNGKQHNQYSVVPFTAETPPAAEPAAPEEPPLPALLY